MQFCEFLLRKSPANPDSRTRLSDVLHAKACTLATSAPPRFRWVKAPTNEELTQLTHTIARRIGRFLERQGLLERDADDCMDAGGRATPGAVAEGQGEG